MNVAVQHGLNLAWTRPMPFLASQRRKTDWFFFRETSRIPFDLFCYSVRAGSHRGKGTTISSGGS